MPLFQSNTDYGLLIDMRSRFLLLNETHEGYEHGWMLMKELGEARRVVSARQRWERHGAVFEDH